MLNTWCWETIVLNLYSSILKKSGKVTELGLLKASVAEIGDQIKKWGPKKYTDRKGGTSTCKSQQMILEKNAHYFIQNSTEDIEKLHCLYFIQNSNRRCYKNTAYLFHAKLNRRRWGNRIFIIPSKNSTEDFWKTWCCKIDTVYPCKNKPKQNYET